jgi:hypothetical protein
MSQEHNRAGHLRLLCAEGLWGRWAGAIWTLIGIGLFVRDDWLSPELQAKLKGPVVAHLLSWQAWTITALVIVVGWLFEASFRAHRRMIIAVTKAETRAAEFAVTSDAPKSDWQAPTIAAFHAKRELETRQLLGVDVRVDALRISLGKDGNFYQVAPAGVRHRRTASVCVENIDKGKFISNCKIFVEFNGYNAPLLEAFTLNATEKRFVPVITHDNGARPDDFVWVCAPRAPGFFAEAYEYLRLHLTDKPTITIKTTSAETRAAEIICRVFIDDSGKLCLEAVP